MFDWSLADGVCRAACACSLAGGLTPENVGDAIRRVRPWGVDVSSGVEATPGSGRKDPVKLRRFIAAAQAAASDPLDARRAVRGARDTSTTGNSDD